MDNQCFLWRWKKASSFYFLRHDKNKMCLTARWLKLAGNGFAYDTAGLERQLRLSVGSAACESAVGSGAATTYVSAVPIIL